MGQFYAKSCSLRFPQVCFKSHCYPFKGPYLTKKPRCKTKKIFFFGKIIFLLPKLCWKNQILNKNLLYTFYFLKRVLLPKKKFCPALTGIQFYLVFDLKMYQKHFLFIFHMFSNVIDLLNYDAVIKYFFFILIFCPLDFFQNRIYGQLSLVYGSKYFFYFISLFCTQVNHIQPDFSLNPKSTHPTVYTLHKTHYTQQIVPNAANRCAVILVPAFQGTSLRNEDGEILLCILERYIFQVLCYHSWALVR